MPGWLSRLGVGLQLRSWSLVGSLLSEEKVLGKNQLGSVFGIVDRVRSPSLVQPSVT